MNLIDLKEKLRLELEKQLINSRILLDKFRVNDEMSRQSGPYQDPKYLPFYYHLGKFVVPKSFLEIGFHLGLASGCFLKQCKTVERFLTFQKSDDEFYSPRLAKANIRDVYKQEFDIYLGQLNDLDFQEKLKSGWDLIIVNEQLGHDDHKSCLDMAWRHLNFDGLLVVEHSNSDQIKSSFSSFCKIMNRDPIYFSTRYGTGILQK